MAIEITQGPPANTVDVRCLFCARGTGTDGDGNPVMFVQTGVPVPGEIQPNQSHLQMGYCDRCHSAHGKALGVPTLAERDELQSEYDRLERRVLDLMMENDRLEREKLVQAKLMRGEAMSGDELEELEEIADAAPVSA